MSCVHHLKFLSALIDAIDAWPAELCAFEHRYEASRDASDVRNPPRHLADVSIPRDKLGALTNVIEFVRTHA